MTEKNRASNSSSSNDAGEKMLTDDELYKIRSAAQGGHRGPQTLALLDHIAALSATIKRLETPVADGEARFVLNEMGNHARSARERGASELANFLERALPIINRQAREIERLKAELNTAKAAEAEAQRITASGTWPVKSLVCAGCGQDIPAYQTVMMFYGRAGFFHSNECAALSLNSVETREMKP